VFPVEVEIITWPLWSCVWAACLWPSFEVPLRWSMMYSHAGTDTTKLVQLQLGDITQSGLGM